MSSVIDFKTMRKELVSLNSGPCKLTKIKLKEKKKNEKNQNKLGLPSVEEQNQRFIVIIVIPKGEESENKAEDYLKQ